MVQEVAEGLRADADRRPETGQVLPQPFPEADECALCPARCGGELFRPRGRQERTECRHGRTQRLVGGVEQAQRVPGERARRVPGEVAPRLLQNVRHMAEERHDLPAARAGPRRWLKKQVVEGHQGLVEVEAGIAAPVAQQVQLPVHPGERGTQQGRVDPGGDRFPANLQVAVALREPGQGPAPFRDRVG